MKIAIQGIKGSFHHQAAQKLLSQQDIEIVECNNFKQVFEALENSQADYGLTAIENNLHGSINEVYRLLEKNDVWISKDLRMHISQNLISYLDISLDELKSASDVKVLSHPVALAQVDSWLSDNLPNATRQEFSDTAASVRRVVELKDAHTLAVASSFAAETFGANVVASDIQDDKQNYTRFILFSKQKVDIPQATHSSIILRTDHKPGALLRCLEVFDKYSCNLTKLDSQPIPGDDEHYSFYIDYELRGNNEELLGELAKIGCKVKVLGQYQKI